MRNTNKDVNSFRLETDGWDNVEELEDISISKQPEPNITLETLKKVNQRNSEHIKDDDNAKPHEDSKDTVSKTNNKKEQKDTKNTNTNPLVLSEKHDEQQNSLSTNNDFSNMTSKVLTGTKAQDAKTQDTKFNRVTTIVNLQEELPMVKKDKNVTLQQQQQQQKGSMDTKKSTTKNTEQVLCNQTPKKEKSILNVNTFSRDISPPPPPPSTTNSLKNQTIPKDSKVKDKSKRAESRASAKQRRDSIKAEIGFDIKLLPSSTSKINVNTLEKHDTIQDHDIKKKNLNESGLSLKEKDAFQIQKKEIIPIISADTWKEKKQQKHKGSALRKDDHIISSRDRIQKLVTQRQSSTSTSTSKSPPLPPSYSSSRTQSRETRPKSSSERIRELALNIGNKSLYDSAKGRDMQNSPASYKGSDDSNDDQDWHHQRDYGHDNNIDNDQHYNIQNHQSVTVKSPPVQSFTNLWDARAQDARSLSKGITIVNSVDRDDVYQNLQPTLITKNSNPQQAQKTSTTLISTYNANSIQSDESDIDIDIGRAPRIKEIPELGSGYVKVTERKPFQKATPREDPTDRDYSRARDTLSSKYDNYPLGWGDEVEDEISDSEKIGASVEKYEELLWKEDYERRCAHFYKDHQNNENQYEEEEEEEDKEEEKEINVTNVLLDKEKESSFQASFPVKNHKSPTQSSPSDQIMITCPNCSSCFSHHLSLTASS